MQVGSDAGVNLVWMGEGLKDVNVMEIAHRLGPPPLAARAMAGNFSRSRAKNWSQLVDSNHRPTLYESVALPTELNWRNQGRKDSRIGGNGKSLLVFKRDGSVFDGGGDALAGLEIAVEELHGERVKQIFLDGALEGTRSELGVVAFLGDEFGSGWVDFEEEALFCEALADFAELDVDDFGELSFVEAVEDDDVVDAVEEFGAEMGLELGADEFLNADLFLGGNGAGVEGFLDDRGADVACQNNDGVAEIDGPPLPVCEASVVEDLEEDVEDVVVGLFDFVEQNDAVGAASDGFAELAAFLVADVAGRGADEACDGVALHVFAHVDADHGGFGIK